MDSLRAKIGLELHVQLNTKTKIFSREPRTFGAIANTFTSEVTLAFPGTLPCLNIEVVKKAIKFGIYCSSKISKKLIFSRKNYFYPDLPKGYQITQEKDPICEGGFIVINEGEDDEKKILLERIQIEEDTGKSIHSDEKNISYLDFNRCGSALIEIVTKPCFSSSKQVTDFLEEIRKILKYLDVSDCNMEEGSLRCDVNISVANENIEGERVEIKNLNSIKNVGIAINFEIKRQSDLIFSNKKVERETRNFDLESLSTKFLRKKEIYHDYRYFVEPNVPIFELEDEFVENIRKEIEIPLSFYYKKYVEEFYLSKYDAKIITSSKDTIKYFENCSKINNNYKSIVNWINGPIRSYLNNLNLEFREFFVPESVICELISMIDEKLIDFSSAVLIFHEILKKNNFNIKELAEKMYLIQSHDFDELEDFIEKTFSEFPDKISSYKSGKVGLLDFFVGDVLKKTKRRFSAEQIKKMILKKI
jgi:aspartyl-tRNA(Asn)/glutamyl-tRNA(Gln) amidotransferase subunit B